MKSPFEIFRNKTLMTILFAMAMLAFVLGGAVQDPAHMPPLLVAAFLGCLVGGIAWIAGIRKKKSNEWGLVGLVVGMILGIAGTIAIGPTAAVRAETGNINQQELNRLIHQRSIANQFVSRATQKARENGAMVSPSTQYFRYHPDEYRDIVAGELLRREADRLGIQVTDEGVNDFIRQITQEKIGASQVREIRDLLQISETTLYEALKQELQARDAWSFLYGRGVPLPPEKYWDFYRQMNIQESIGIVPIPVEEFLDESAAPSEAELQKLFTTYKANFPNTTLEGRLDEGRPGFRQPQRAALEYVEIPYDAIEKTVGEVSDAEIEAFYEQFYKSAHMLDSESSSDATSPADTPLLPEMAGDESRDGDKAETKPEDGDAPGDNKAVNPAQAPDVDTSKSGPTTDEPANEPTKDGESPVKPEEPPGDKPAEPAKDESPQPADDQSGASLPTESALQLVAFVDEQSPPEGNESSEPSESKQEAASEAPAASQPAEVTPEAQSAPDAPAGEPENETPKSAETSPAEPSPTTQTPEDPKPDEQAPGSETESAAMKEDVNEAPADGQAPGDESAAPPKPRELDDELRGEIRDQILRRKTSERQQELMTKVFEFMAQDLAYGATSPKDDPAYLSPEETTQKLKQFAAGLGLVYDRTPLLSFPELSRSEDYPIGHAVSAVNFRSMATVAQMAFNSAPSDLYRAEQVMDLESSSRFVYWKMSDVAAYEPASLDDAGIREQVVSTWRELQAREKARARAEELSKQAEGVDKPLSEVFAGTTVTGKQDGQAVSVIHPPRFSWLSRASTSMSPDAFNRPTPTRTELRTVPGLIGDSFMSVVFNDLRPGEVGVAHSMDEAYYYVVRVDERTYGTSPDLAAFRERFTREQLFAPLGLSDYSGLADRELQSYQTNWSQELFDRHHVDFSGLERSKAESES